MCKGIALIIWEEKVRAPKHTHLFEAGDFFPLPPNNIYSAKAARPVCVLNKKEAWRSEANFSYYAPAERIQIQI